MMSAVRARRQPRSLPSEATASRPMSREYDDNQLRDEQTLGEVLPGQDLASRWVDIDDAEESDVGEPFEVGGADLVGKTSPCRSSRNKRTNSLARTAF